MRATTHSETAGLCEELAESATVVTRCLFQAKFNGGSQCESSVVIGSGAIGVITAMLSCHMPSPSKFPKMGAMWFIVVWQLAHTTDCVSRNGIGSFEIDSKGHGEVKSLPSTWVGVSATSAGIFAQVERSLPAHAAGTGHVAVNCAHRGVGQHDAGTVRARAVASAR